ncbi:KH domain-containing protein [Candidatus Parcubacteria bacterium]|nr:KH domain-containing protein [Candidatus Parcubacteria bacterium]
MLSKEDFDKIKDIVKEFFQKTCFDVEIEFLPQKDTTIPIDIKTDEPQILIGEGGQTLVEIQHLLKAILKRKIKQDFYIDLDIDDYKKKKIEYLKDLAKSSADEVVLAKNEKILPPMFAYERRIIHLELAERKDVITESIDREPERKVLIKPCV